MDGGSLDRTLAIVDSYRATGVRLAAGSVSGVFSAMNRGLAEFTGDAIGYLNSDDTFHDSEVLGRVDAALTNADIVYGDLVMVTDHVSKHKVRTWIAGQFTRRSLRWGWMAPHPSFYMRRDAVEAMGQFNLRYGLASDYDFMLRAFLVEKFTIAYIPNTLVDFMIGGISTRSLSAVVRGNLECTHSRHVHLGTPAIDAAFALKPLSKLLQLHWP